MQMKTSHRESSEARQGAVRSQTGSPARDRRICRKSRACCSACSSRKETVSCNVFWMPRCCSAVAVVVALIARKGQSRIKMVGRAVSIALLKPRLQLVWYRRQCTRSWVQRGSRWTRRLALSWSPGSGGTFRMSAFTPEPRHLIQPKESVRWPIQWVKTSCLRKGNTLGQSTRRRLLAHELTHAIQQGNVSRGPIVAMSEPGDASELEARQVAEHVMQMAEPLSSESLRAYEMVPQEGA